MSPDQPDSEVKAVARAVEETAKATGKAIDLTGNAGGFLERVFGDLIEDSVGVLSDRIKVYRQKNLIVLVDKARRDLEARGITKTSALPPRFALPLIESASLESEETLQDMWAGLLASAMDADRTVSNQHDFVEVMRQLRTETVTLLELLHLDEVTPRHESIFVFTDGADENAGRTNADLVSELEAIVQQWNALDLDAKYAAVLLATKLGLVQNQFNSNFFAKDALRRAIESAGDSIHDTSPNQQEVDRFVSELSEQMKRAAGRIDDAHRSGNALDKPENTLELTPYGKMFMAACKDANDPTVS